MLSFEIKDSGKSIQVDCDSVGLEALIGILTKYREAGGKGHLHLCAPSAGGNLLSDKTPWGKDAVGELIISMGGDD